MSLAERLENELLTNMDLGRFVAVEVGTEVSATIAAMNLAATSCAIVCRGDHVVGLFTDRDVLMRVANHPETWQGPIEAVMTPEPAKLRDSASAAAALALMTDLHVRNVPVVDAHAALVGNVSYATIMGLAADFLDGLAVADVGDLSTESGLLFIDFTGLTPHKPVTVGPDDRVADALHQMRSRAIGCVLVVDDREHLIGVMTESDVQSKLVCTDVDPATARVHTFMTEAPVTLSPRAPIATAVRRMAEFGFTHVPLVAETGRPVGMVSFRDIAEFLDLSLATLH